MSEEKLPPQEEKAPPTKEEVIAFFKEQIEVKKVQAELQELNTRIANGRAEEMRAMAFIAQMTNPQTRGNEYEGDGIPHTLTEEDMEANPELKEQGLQAGDQVLIPAEEKPKEKRGLKKK